MLSYIHRTSIVICKIFRKRNVTCKLDMSKMECIFHLHLFICKRAIGSPETVSIVMKQRISRSENPCLNLPPLFTKCGYTSIRFYKVDHRMQYILKQWRLSKYKFFMQGNLRYWFYLGPHFLNYKTDRVLVNIIS